MNFMKTLNDANAKLSIQIWPTQYIKKILILANNGYGIDMSCISILYFNTYYTKEISPFISGPSVRDGLCKEAGTVVEDKVAEVTASS